MNIKKIFKRELTQEDRIKAEIDSIEFKKSTILKGVEDDRQRVDREIQQVFRRIGSIVYENHLAEVKGYNFEEQFKQISELRCELKEQESRIEEIVDNYNYEISLLEANLNVDSMTINSPQISNGEEFCGMCGNKLSFGDMFCNKCGAKRSEGDKE